MTISYSHARSTRQHHPSRIYRWELHYPQKSSCPPESLSNLPSSTPYFFAVPYFHTSSLPPFLTPSNTSQSCSLSPIQSLLQGLGILAWAPWCRAGTDTTSHCLTPNQALTPQQLCRIHSLGHMQRNQRSPISHRRRNLTGTAKQHPAQSSFPTVNDEKLIA